MKLLKRCSYCQNHGWPSDENHLQNMRTVDAQLTSMATVLMNDVAGGRPAAGRKSIGVGPEPPPVARAFIIYRG